MQLYPSYKPTPTKGHPLIRSNFKWWFNTILTPSRVTIPLIRPLPPKVATPTNGHPSYKATPTKGHPSYKATPTKGCHSYKATSTKGRPSYKATSTKGHYSHQVSFYMNWDSKILLICPLKRVHPSLKVTFSLQRGWPYNRGTTVYQNKIQNLSDSNIIILY
jgi:hypothetical protein